MVQLVSSNANKKQNETKYVYSTTIGYDFELNELGRFVEVEKKQAGGYKKLVVFIPVKVHKKSFKILNDPASEDNFFIGIIVFVDLASNEVQVVCTNSVYNVNSQAPKLNIFFLEKIKKIFGIKQLIIAAPILASLKGDLSCDNIMIIEIFFRLANGTMLLENMTNMPPMKIDQLQLTQITNQHQQLFQECRTLDLSKQLEQKKMRERYFLIYKNKAEQLTTEDIRIMVDDFLNEFIYPDVFLRPRGGVLNAENTLDTSKSIGSFKAGKDRCLLEHIYNFHFVVDAASDTEKLDNLVNKIDKNNPKSQFIAKDLNMLVDVILESIKQGIKNGTIYITYKITHNGTLNIIIQIPIIQGMEIGIAEKYLSGSGIKIIKDGHIFICLNQQWVNDHWDYKFLPKTVHPGAKTGDYRPGEVAYKNGMEVNLLDGVSFSGSWVDSRPNQGELKGKGFSYLVGSDTDPNQSLIVSLEDGCLLCNKKHDVDNHLVIIDDATIIYPNGDFYIGQVCNKKRHGIGILYNKDKQIIKNGKWQKNEFIPNEEFVELKYDKFKRGGDDDGICLYPASPAYALVSFADM